MSSRDARSREACRQPLIQHLFLVTLAEGCLASLIGNRPFQPFAHFLPSSEGPTSTSGERPSFPLEFAETAPKPNLWHSSPSRWRYTYWSDKEQRSAYSCPKFFHRHDDKCIRSLEVVSSELQVQLHLHKIMISAFEVMQKDSAKERDRLSLPTGQV